MTEDKDFKEPEGLPEGWERVNLEKDVILITGLRPKGGAVDEGVPSLGGEHISEDGRVIFTEQNARYIPEKFFKLMTKGKAEINDILINKDGANTGKVAILKAKFYPHIVINEHLFILRSKSLFEQKYLFYWLFSSFAQIEIKNRVTGSAQPGLSSSFIKNFFVLRPSLSEQRKIAEILETVDNAIEKTEKIIEKYKRIKQGLMQDLLTKGIDENGNIRDEKTHKFKDSPLGRIPEEWEVVRLGEVSKVKRGASPRPIDDPIFFTEEGKGRAWVRIEDVMKSNKYLTETRQYLSALGESKSVKVDVGDVVMSICATVGKPIIINIPACIHDGFVVFKNLSCKVDRHFLYYLITFKEKEIAKLGQIGTQGNLNSKIVSDFRIPLPPLSEQKRIAEILSQIDQAIEKEEQYKEKLERLKQGLMQDLLTGKVRVNHLIEEGAENVST